MADLAFPFMMPTSGVAKSTFSLSSVSARNNLISGSSYGTQLAPDYWDIEITTGFAGAASQRLRDWRRFCRLLRGGLKIGLFYDADLPRPSAYLKTGIVGLPIIGGGSFDGTAHISTITDNFNMTISGLPVGLVLHYDDYVGLVQNGRYFLAVLQQDATANGSGVATINFLPELPSLFDASATVVLEKPCCEGFLVGTPDIPREIEGGTIHLTARSRAY